MEFEVDGWNNFCRVFEIPKKFPSGYCFSGGWPVSFQMVDWFNPIPDVAIAGVFKEVWKKEIGDIKVKSITLEELYNSLIPWLKEKRYMKKGYEYLVLFDFGAVIRFQA